MMKAELKSCISKKGAELRQVPARLHCLSKAVAQASHAQAHVPKERFAIICKAQAPSSIRPI